MKSFAFLIAASLTMLPPAALARDLTGIWKSSGTDKLARGTYYIRMVGNDVFWIGESADGGILWKNTFHGSFEENKIQGKWVDVPPAANQGAGTIEMEYRPDTDTIVAKNATGNFTGKLWIRVDPN